MMAAEKELKTKPVAEMDTDVELISEVVDEKDVIHLKKPLPNGNTQLIFDFDRVNGYTLLKCEKQAKKEDSAISYLPFSQVYQAFVAAAAAKVKYDDILNLDGADFIAVTTRVQGFLMNVGR